MTLVKNALSHPYTPTVGSTLAPFEIGDVTLTYPQEIDAVNIGALIVIDPDYVPPTPPTPPLTGSWRPPVEATADLPLGGNDRGDVRLVLADTTGGTVARYWDGDSWEVLAGGGGSGTPPPGDLTFAGVDGTGPWIDGAVSSTVAGVDGTGPWIDGAITSTRAGVDGTGPWIDPT